MLQNSCRQYPSVPALRPGRNLAEDGCSHHVSTCNGFNNTSSTTAAATTSTTAAASPSSHPPPPPLPSLSAATNTSTEANGGRSCTVCGATKTPLWRTGPQGPKSLCNACGIRARKMHERQYQFAPQHPPQASAASASLGSCTWMDPSDGAISDGSAYGRKAWNGDIAGENHGHYIQTNLHCENGDDDDDCLDDGDGDGDGDGEDSLAMAMPSTSSPSQQVSIKHCPSVRHLSFKRRALRSPGSAPPRPYPKPWPTLLSSLFSFSRDDEQAALLLMALSHGLTLSK